MRQPIFCLSLLLPAIITCMLIPGLSFGQPLPPSFADNYYTDQVGRGLYVTAPGSLAAQLSHTFAAENSNPSPWGASLSTPFYNVQVIKAVDSLACGTLQNGTGSIPSLSGKFALIYRGSCEFGQKALAAQQAGAAGVLIINNVPGLLNMAPGMSGGSVTIPVIMINKTDGDAINNAIKSSQTVTISFTPWRTGVTNDLGIVKGGLAQYHNYALPKSMLSSNSVPYLGIVGGYVANFGTSTLTNVKLKGVLNFTPTAGSPYVLHQDSATYATFPTTDSVYVLLAANPYSIPPSISTGRVDVTYTASSTQTDNYPFNNTATQSFYITDSVLSKGRYDMQNKVPVSDIAISFVNTNTLGGPLYYIAAQRHTAKRVQFSVSGTTGGPNLAVAFGSVDVYLFRWDDGNISSNNFIEAGELTLVGQGTKTFATTDTNGMIFAAELVSASIPGTHPVLDSNKWYWVVIDAPQGMFIGCDGNTDYNRYPRSLLRANHTGNNFVEYYGATFPGDVNALMSSAGNQPQVFPFGNSQFVNSVSFTDQKQNHMPTIAMHVAPGISATTIVKHPCNGTNDGTITVTATSGKSPYQYKLGSGTFQSSNTYSNLAPGNYTITVRDDNGITGEVEVTLTNTVVNDNLTYTGPTSFCQGDSLVVKSGNNKKDYTFKWLLNGSDISGATDSFYTIKSSGTYSVKVSRLACTDSTGLTVTVHALPTVDAGPDVTINEGNNTQIGGNPTASGNGPFNYNWTPTTALSSATVANPTASCIVNTTYTVTVTDANSCVNKNDVTITVNSIHVGDINNKLGLNVYPNPANDVVNIVSAARMNGIYHIEMTDAAGRLAYKKDLNITDKTLNEGIDIAGFADGFYFIAVGNGNIKAVFKIEKVSK